MRVHDPCVGADSMYSDQYCSCIISIVYFEKLGSFRMLCVRDEFLQRLYYKIAIVLIFVSLVIIGRDLSRYVLALVV